MAYTPRVNLVTNPSFKTDATGWSALGAGTAVARVTTDYYIGDSCLRVTKAAVVDSGATTSTRAAVAGSTVYTASAYVKVPDGQEDAGLYLSVTWYDAGGTAVGSAATGATVLLDSLSDWVRLSATGTSHADAVTAAVTVAQAAEGTASQTFLLDAVMLEASGFLRAYHDELAQGAEIAVVDSALRRVPAPHLTGAELNADIALGSLVFNTVDEDGVLWVVTAVEGWWNLPVPQMPVIERGFADGAYDSRGRFEARGITLKGVILPPSREYLPAARERFMNAVNLVYRGDWLRLDEDPTKACFVRLVNQPDVDTVNPRGRTEFTVQLRAADPIKYKWEPNQEDGYELATIAPLNVTAVNDGTETLHNEGNTDVTVKMLISGPVVGPYAAIDNLSTGQNMTIIGTTRPARAFAVSSRSALDGTATLTMGVSRHNVRVGDAITVTGVAAGYNGEWLVTGVGATTVSYYAAVVDAGATAVSPPGLLESDRDYLEIDTYDREVAVNGLVEGARAQLDTIVDWLTLRPGDNQLFYYDAGALSVYVRSYTVATSVVTLTTVTDHEVYPGDSIRVYSPDAVDVTQTVATNSTETTVQYVLPGAADTGAVNLGPVVYTDTRVAVVDKLAYSLTGNVVTVTTVTDHGMAVDDYVTLDGGDTTWGPPPVNFAVSDSAYVAIDTYSFDTTTDVLTVTLTSTPSPAWVVGDKIEITDLGSEFDGVVTIATIAGAVITAAVVSTTPTVGVATNAPSEATARRVYPIASVPTKKTLTYVLKSGGGTAVDEVTVTPRAGELRLVGDSSMQVSYRSGWIS